MVKGKIKHKEDDRIYHDIELCNDEWIILEKIKCSKLYSKICNEELLTKEDITKYKYKIRIIDKEKYYNYYYLKYDNGYEVMVRPIGYGLHLYGAGKLRWFLENELQKSKDSYLYNKVCLKCKREENEIDQSIEYYKELAGEITKYKINEEEEKNKKKDNIYILKNSINYKKKEYKKYDSIEIKDLKDKHARYIEALKKLDEEMGI